MFILRLLIAAIAFATFTNRFASRARADQAARPRLVVLITVDQLPQEYLQRFGRGLSDDAFFARATREGYQFDNCHHGHAFTFTGPGHAVLLTGAYPRTSGIIGNAWYDREKGKNINCVADDDARIIGAASGAGASALNLKAPTLGDQLKLTFGDSAKVFAIGWKDRSPILTAGRLADGVYWFQEGSGNWVTSDAYQEALPGWLRVLNEGNAARAYAGQAWTLLFDRGRYQTFTEDDNPFEKPGSGLSRAFPHELPAADDSSYFRRLINSPFANEYTLLTAREMIEREQLGSDDVPDLLSICLSANDYVGHAFGPHSLEVEDMLYRTDRQLAELLDYLDQKVGTGRWTVALTSDHGVAPIPEYAASLGLDAARNPLGSFGDVRKRLETHLRERLGIDPEEAGPLVLHVDSTQVFLGSHPLMHGERLTAAQRLVRDWLLEQPSVADAVTREELLSGGGAGDRLRVMLHRAFHNQVSGDVLYVTKPYQFEAGSLCTSHGSPWQYDTHVPLIFLGAGVEPGRSTRLVHPGSIAATLARVLGIAGPAACEHESLW